MDELKLSKEDIARYLVTENDIIIARSGIPGATRLIYEFDANTIYCGFIIRYQVLHKNLKNYLFFKLKELEYALSRKSAGTIMSNVNQETLKDLLVYVPNPNTLKLFNECIFPIFEKININNKENAELIKLKDYITPILMSGQIGFKK